MSYCINQNHCGNTNFKWEEYITEIPHQNYVSGVVVHDQLHCRHNFDQVSLNTETGEMHCRSAAVLAKKIKCLLLEDEGCAEMYPYEIIDQLDQIYQSLY